jgi:endonuclease IV
MNQIIFAQDVMLTKPNQEKARKKIFKKMHNLGFKNAGIEFIFINEYECAHLQKLEAKVQQWKKFMEDLFEETRFSIHAPWIPPMNTNLIEGKGMQLMRNLAAFGDGSIDAINIHMAMGIPLQEWKKRYSHYSEKQACIESISTHLGELTDHHPGICVETMPGIDLPEEGVHFFCLAGDFEYILKNNKKANMCVDTCHTGITNLSCKKIVEKNVFPPGFYKEELSDIKKTAYDSDAPFLKFGKRIKHLHFSDYGKNDRAGIPLHGASFGKGMRTEKEMMDLLKRYEKVIGTDTISAVLEMNEDSYSGDLPTMQHALGILRKHGQE